MEKSLAIKIVGILFYVLFGVSLIMGIAFYFNYNADMLLYWSYVLAATAAVLVVALSFIGIFKSKKSLISSLIVLGAFGALVLTCYALSSDAMPTFFGSETFELTPSGLKWIDTGLFTMYALMGGAFIGLVFTEIKSAFN
jgi:hypothetical protein